MDSPSDDTSKDPKAYQAYRQDYTEQDFEGKLFHLLMFSIYCFWNVSFSLKRKLASRGRTLSDQTLCEWGGDYLHSWDIKKNPDLL
jgi:hypothetical protein